MQKITAKRVCRDPSAGPGCQRQEREERRSHCYWADPRAGAQPAEGKQVRREPANGWLRGGKKAERAKSREREKGEKGIPFLFLKHIFKTKFNSNLNSFVVLVKPKHHKNKYASA